MLCALHALPSSPRDFSFRSLCRVAPPSKRNIWIPLEIAQQYSYVFRVPAKYSAWLKTEILAEFWPENILDAFNGGQTSERIAADRFISCSILGEWSDSVYQWTGRGGTKETQGTWFERKVHHFKGKRIHVLPCVCLSLCGSNNLRSGSIFVSLKLGLISGYGSKWNPIVI